MPKFTVKITQLFVCPICKKEYKRKGFYLNKHLKKCSAIAWIPKTKCEIAFKRINEHLLTQALETMISGNIQSVDFWKIQRKNTAEINQECGRGTVSDYKEVMAELRDNISRIYI